MYFCENTSVIARMCCEELINNISGAQWGKELRSDAKRSKA